MSLLEAEQPALTTQICLGLVCDNSVMMTTAGAPWNLATSTTSTRAPAATRFRHPAMLVTGMLWNVGPVVPFVPDTEGLAAWFGAAAGEPCSYLSSPDTWLVRLARVKFVLVVIGVTLAVCPEC